MEYLGRKFVVGEVNGILKTFGMRERDRAGEWIHAVLVMLFIAGATLAFISSWKSAFPPREIYVPFRNTQIVRNLTPDFRKENAVKLDTAGTLTPIFPSGTDPRVGIEMVLNTPKYLQLDGMGGGSASFFAGPENTYTFNQHASSSHKVGLGIRTFLVTLDYISPVGDPLTTNEFEYTFSVYEE